MSGQGNISLVPEYGTSSSESESDSEDKAQSHTFNSSRAQPQSTLGTKLSSILPPPKNRAGLGAEGLSSQKRQATARDTVEGKKIKIVVDLPRVATTQAEPSIADQSNLSNQSRQDNSGSGSGPNAHSGSVFADLSSILPAPKNSKSVLGRLAVQSMGDHTEASRGPPSRTQQSVLVPHSLAKKQKGKTADKKDNAASTIPPLVNNIDNDGEHLESEESVPFFTIGASQQDADANASSADVDTDGAGCNIATSNQAGEMEMYYDPSSGYYYDHTSGRYYYYDPDSCRYIDAHTLYQDQSGEHMTEISGDKPSLESNIDKADIEKLIGRSAFKRGEANAMIGMSVKDLSHRSQLAGSNYSDAKSGAEFAAKRAADMRRRATHTIIEGDAVDKKKKQKHNIMYLALQAQEQESDLKDAHANRKSARKAARSKYGL